MLCAAVVDDEIINDRDHKEPSKVQPCEAQGSVEELRPSTIQNDIYLETSVLDLFHFLQISSDSSQLERENSHFILADIAISSNELIKTSEEDEANYEVSQRSHVSNQLLKPRLNSDVINIVIPDNIKRNSLSNTPSSIFSNTISSFRKEVFIGSGLSSPYPDSIFPSSASTILSLPRTSSIPENLSQFNESEIFNASIDFIQGLNEENSIEESVAKPSTQEFLVNESAESETNTSIGAYLVQKIIERNFFFAFRKNQIPNLRQIEVLIQFIEIGEFEHESFENNQKVINKASNRSNNKWFQKVISYCALKESIFLGINLQFLVVTLTGNTKYQKTEIFLNSSFKRHSL